MGGKDNGGAQESLIEWVSQSLIIKAPFQRAQRLLDAA